MIDDYDFYEEAEEYEQYVPDSYFEEAQGEIRNMLILLTQKNVIK